MSRDASVPNETGIEKDVDVSPSGGGNGRLRCPICAWEPQSDSVWMCHCKHLWNTFDTGGVCPSCLTQWSYTACVKCGSWSPHSDWYSGRS